MEVKTVCLLFIPGTIRAKVGIRALNKTSEEYWFLMKFNLSNVGGDVDIKDVKTVTQYFLVRLWIDSRLAFNSIILK